jgi:curved DNA-binding protein CbpA
MLELLKNPTKRQIYDKYGEDPANLYELDGFNLEYYLLEIFVINYYRKLEDGLGIRASFRMVSHVLEVWPFLIMCLIYGMFNQKQFKGLFAINILFS